MMIIGRKLTRVALVTIVALAGCSELPLTVSPPTQQTDPLLAYVVSLGFPPHLIEDAGDHFVVSGDMTISKDVLRKLLADTLPSLQKQYPQLVNSTTVQNITVNVSQLDAAWQTAARAALVEWNSVTPGVRVHFAEASSAQIPMFFDYLPYGNPGSCIGTIARAEWPVSGGGPGFRIRVNEHFRADGCLSANQKKWTMVHELGHTIGMVHTDDGCGPPACYQIPGTPTSDPFSIMNAMLSSNFAFSDNDKKAAIYLYPVDGPIGSISFPGGVPTITWSSVSGATSYRVRLRQDEFYLWYNYETGEDYGSWSGKAYEDVGTTTSTTIAHPSRTNTGAYGCYYSQPWVPEELWRNVDGYVIEAVFEHGFSRSSTPVQAPVARSENYPQPADYCS